MVSYSFYRVSMSQLDIIIITDSVSVHSKLCLQINYFILLNSCNSKYKINNNNKLNIVVEMHIIRKMNERFCN